jgi:hypothetical protein
LFDLNLNGICDQDELSDLWGALEAGELCAQGTWWNPVSEQCEPSTCAGDFDGDGWVFVNDLLELLAIFETPCGN